jgi:RNA polymerase sigma-70 factor (ECF subfamily)
MTVHSISIARPGDAVVACRGITPDMTDGALVRAALDGDDRAFTMLVDRHAPACLRFAKRMLGEMADAEDAAQETFLRAFNALGSYDNDSPFRTWLFAILVNRCRTSLLRRSRRERRMVREEVEVEHAAPHDEALAFEFRDEIARALARLAPEQREAFLLKHVEDLSYDEMAVVTGAGTSALRMRVKRACDRLQLLLHERGRNGTDAW